MRISLVQMPVVNRDVRGNLERAARHLDEAVRRRSQLILLPEMFNTGFAYRDFPALAQEALPETLALMRHTARRAGAWMAGSMPEVHDGSVYNVLFWMGPDGEVAARYQKVHLFAPMGESERMGAGSRIVSVASEHGRLGGCICYDIRFPEVTRRLAIEGVRLLVVPAQFPHPRREHWLTLLRARAIENQYWVAGANIVGTVGKLEFFGASRVISPWGDEVAGADGEETLITADIDLAQADDVRSLLPSLSARRADVYGELTAPDDR